MFSARFLVLLLALATYAHAYCWNDQKIVGLKKGQHQRYVTSTSSCSQSASTYYVGNYTVRSLNSDDYYIMYFGDQLCGTVSSDDSYFDYASFRYTDNFTNKYSFSYRAAYPSYYAKISVECDSWLPLGTCDIEGSFCLTIYSGETHQALDETGMEFHSEIVDVKDSKTLRGDNPAKMHA